MKLKSLIFILSFLFFSKSVFGQYTYTQKLGSLGSVMLPDTPKLTRTKEGGTVYVSNYRGVLFIAQVDDISGGFNLFHKNNADSVYNSYIRGFLGSLNGKLFYKNKIKIQGHDALEFGYKTQINGQQTYSHNRIVTANDTLLMCGILSSDSLPKDHPVLSNFFKGFVLKSNRQLALNNASRLGYEAGQVVGILIVLAVLTTIGLAFVFLIKKIAYKNKSHF